MRRNLINDKDSYGQNDGVDGQLEAVTCGQGTRCRDNDGYDSGIPQNHQPGDNLSPGWVIDDRFGFLGRESGPGKGGKSLKTRPLPFHAGHHQGDGSCSDNEKGNEDGQ